MSDQVFQSSMKYIQNNLAAINDGKLSVSEVMFKGAKDAWKNARLPHGHIEDLSAYFPGNLFALNPWSSNFSDRIISAGSLSGIEGALNADSYGKSLSDFAGLPGFSTHIITDYAGTKLTIVRDDQTGHTVYVGTAGDGLETVEDALLISDANPPNGFEIKNAEYLNRQENKAIRQHEEPGLLTLTSSGDIVATLRDLAKQARAAARKKPVHPAMKLHNLLMDYQRNQQTRSYAPIPKVASRRGSGDDSLMQAPGPEGGVPAWRQPYIAHAAASPVHGSHEKSPADRLARNLAPAPLPPGFAPLYKPQDTTHGNAPAVSVMSKYVKREEFIELLEQHLNRAARMPSSGYTGFDPLLTPL